MMAGVPNFHTSFFLNNFLSQRQACGLLYNENVKQKQSCFNGRCTSNFHIISGTFLQNPSDFRWSFFLFVVWLLLSKAGRGGRCDIRHRSPSREAPCCGPTGVKGKLVDKQVVRIVKELYLSEEISRIMLSCDWYILLFLFVHLVFVWLS
jgi:hypothetical protein